MTERPKITLKTRAPARDPHRQPVRAMTAPRPAPRPPRQTEPPQVPSQFQPEQPPAPRAEGPFQKPAPARRAHDTRQARPVRPHAAPRDTRPAFGKQNEADRPGFGRPNQDQRSAFGKPGERTNERPPAARPNNPRPTPNVQTERHRQPSAPTPPPTSAPAPRTAAAAATTSTGVRVAKLITERGLASRREADEWIEAGYIRVNGRAVVLGQRVAADAVIDIDPRARAQQLRRVTVLLHKPVGYVSGQPEDGHEPAIALIKQVNRWSGDASRIDFHPGHLRSLAPAGRLDIESTGLLVFTQDGRIAKLLIGDQTRAEKEYLVRVRYTREGNVPESDMELMRHGMVLDGVPLRHARVSWQNEEQLRVVLREGKKRQIRRMCEMVGLEVLGLKRVRIGSVALGPLPPGQWRYLRDDERF